jgi:hypothetical protein
MRTPALFALFAATSIAACGGANNTTAPSPQTLAGTWRATRAEFVSRASSSLRVDVVSQGTTMVLTLASNNAYTLTITDPGHSPQATTGTWSSSTDVLTLRPTGMPFSIEFDMTMSGSTLTLTGGSVEFDFNADGVNEEATLNATFARQ